MGGGGILAKMPGTRMAANGMEGHGGGRKAAEGRGRQSKTLKVLKKAMCVEYEEDADDVEGDGNK